MPPIMPPGADPAEPGDQSLAVSASHTLGTFHGIEPRPNATWRPLRFLSRADEARLVLPVAGVITRVDPLMSRVHARRMRAWLADDYRAMREEAPDLGRLPGAVDLAAASLLGLAYDTGHYFAFLPTTAPAASLGVMVFLHGHAGNFRMLAWRWRALAARAGLAVLVPSGGFGFWRSNSRTIVAATLEDARRRWPVINPSRGLWLCGLSAGGGGVIRCAGEFEWDGLIFLSATMSPGLIDDTARRMTGPWPDSLVLHGQRDHNVSPSSVRRGVERLRQRGVSVDRFVYDDEDHFLIFAQAADVDRRMIEWMARRQEVPAVPGVES